MIDCRALVLAMRHVSLTARARILAAYQSDDSRVGSKPDAPSAIAAGEATEASIKRGSTNNATSAGRSLNVCAVATGKIDLCSWLCRTVGWGSVTGSAVLKRARVYRIDTTKPLACGEANPFIFAYAPDVALKGR